MSRLLVALAVVLAAPTLAPAQEKVTFRFQVNDALVKDSNLAGVTIHVSEAADGDRVEVGLTDASGAVSASLAPGTYLATYTKPSYVSIEATEFELREAGQVITTSLLPSLESEGEGEPAPLRVELILNWGSEHTQVKDADSHLWVVESGAHVYFSNKADVAPDSHPLSLDVDDTDWGGPETVTLHGSPPGTYVYWVHDYTGGDGTLGKSDVVVRLIDGNTLLAEYRTEPTISARMWRPFKHLVVDDAHILQVVEWTPEELQRNEHLRLPASIDEAISMDTSTDVGGAELIGCLGVMLAVAFMIFVAALLVRKAF